MARLLLFLIFLLSARASWAQLTPYRLDKVLGTPVGSPRDVVVDHQGNIYLADGNVNKLDSTGRFLTSYPAPVGGGVSALALDAADNLYVSCNGPTVTNDVIRKYSPSGQLLLSFGTIGYSTGGIQLVAGLSVGANGVVYVAESGRNQVMRYDAQGNFLGETSVRDAQAVSELKDVGVDAAGNVYALLNNYMIAKLNATGQLLGRFGLGNATGAGVYQYWAEVLQLDPAGNLLVSVSQGGISRYSSTGTLLGSLSQNFSSSTHTAMAFDQAGNLYATDFTHQIFSNHLYKFSPAGTLRRRWGNLTSLAYVRQDESGNLYTYDGSTVRKYDAAGQLVLSFGASLSFSGYLGGFAVDDQGYIYALGTSDTASQLLKFDPQGRQVARFTSFGFASSYQLFNGLAIGPGGTIYLSDQYGHRIRRLDAAGNFLGAFGSMGTGAGQLYSPRAVAVDGGGNVYVADYDGLRVQKFSASGQVLKQYGPSPPANSSISVGSVDLELDGRGNVYVATFYNGGKIFAADGSTTAAMPSYGTAVSVNRRATRLLSLAGGSDVVRCFVPASQPPVNLISGQLFNDLNANCQRDAGEATLGGIAVVAEPGGYYGLTDATGHYVLAVDTGRYQVRPLAAPNEVGRTLQQLCAPSVPVAFSTYNNSATGTDFSFQVSTTPFLRVSVASNRRRRCARNETVATYDNLGYASATNVTVAVLLPPQVVLVGADHPYVRNAAGQYVFAVGTVPAGQGGRIVLQDSVVCGDPSLLGVTVCTKAWISPANSYPPPAGWNQASLRVRGAAQAGNQARFVLQNTGTGNMTDSLSLRLYQNTDLALTHRFQLPAGDSLVLRVPASQPVLRLEAEQPPAHPTQRLASATVEVRALAPAGQPSPAMNALPPNAPGPADAEDCQPIRDSYDPNDKQVFPTGVTAQHYTPTGVPLHYRVRFQNTGTDDAYRVEVVDTLSAGLDLRTLRVEAASHPYQLRVAGHGRPVLTFAFEKLNLPPNSRSEAASNGFVQFSVQPLASLPAWALVENYADIFFDYNPPVRTNTTTNRLYDLPAAVVPAVALTYPAVVASPSVAQLSPTQGRAGTLVTISGQRLATGGAPRVLFSGVAAPVLSATTTALTVRVPAGSSTGAVQVVTADGGTRAPQPFTVFQPPTLAALAPAEGVAGDLFTITGTAFSPVATQDTVWLGGVLAPVRQATTTTLQVAVPPGARTGLVRVSTLGGRAESAQPFVVWLLPAIANFSPARGKAGDLLTLTGTNFAPAARNAVLVGGQAAPVPQASATSLQVRVPAGARSGPLELRTPGGLATSASSFTFWPAPTLLAFTPAAGSVGDVITLTGTDFLVDGRPDTVLFNGQRAAVLAATSTSATVRVPRGASSGVLTVAGTGGRAASTAPFTVLGLDPAAAIAVYPNPAHGTLTLDWLHADFTLASVQLYNSLGTRAFQAELSSLAGTSMQVPLAALAPGLYLLVVQTSQGPVTKRLTVY